MIMSIKIQLHECPACRADLVKYHTEDAEQYEWWRFECGAEIVNGPGGLEENEPCRDDRLGRALKKLNNPDGLAGY